MNFNHVNINEVQIKIEIEIEIVGDLSADFHKLTVLLYTAKNR